MSVALARPMPADPSWGETGGIFAGIVAILYAIGKGIRWAFDWNDRRTETRSAKLEAWEARLEKREADFENKIENRMAAVEAENVAVRRENRGLRMAFQHVSAALVRCDPKDPALLLAERILAQSIPLDPYVPPDMTDSLDRMP